MPAIDLSILNQRQTPAFYADTLANRPAAGFVGRIFVSTNTFAFYRDNGTGWDLIGGPGTGTITGSGTVGTVPLWNGASTIGDSSLIETLTEIQTSKLLRVNSFIISSTEVITQKNSIAGDSVWFGMKNGSAVNRWNIGANAVEAGANSGFNFNLWRYDDAGVNLGFVIRANRSSGNVDFSNNITAAALIKSGGTSTEFLKADGSVDSNTYNTGSGVAGQVAFFSGTNAITGNNDLFWDNVNGHLGIGTIIPGTALDVKHDQSTVVQLEQETATNDIRIAFINSGVGLWRLGAFYNAGANDFGLFDIAAAAQPVTVKRTTGQVLIGTSTVGSGKLVVASATGDNGVQIVGASAPSLRIDNAESGPTKRAGLGISTATNNFIQGSADRDFCMFNGSTTASPILFGIYDTTNVQEAARISAARNLLVGTVTDSGQKLIVNGTALISNSLLLGQTGVTNGIINSNDGMYFNIDSDSSGGTPEFMFGKQRNGAGSGGTTFMTISNAGNVGINTITPTAAKLVVFSSDTTITMFGQNIDSSTTIGNSFVSRFRNGFDGNGLYSLTSFQVQNAAGTDQISFIGAQSVTGAGNYSPNTVIGVRSGASTFAEYMRIVGSTGNLLIGTTTDNGNKLQVNGSSYLGTQSIMCNTLNGTGGQYSIGISQNYGATSWSLDLSTILLNYNLTRALSISLQILGVSDGNNGTSVTANCYRSISGTWVINTVSTSQNGTTGVTSITASGTTITVNFNVTAFGCVGINILNGG
jgi:hypothetical protein